MKLPKMILFDYGDTLLCEQNPDFLFAENKIFEYVKTNPKQVTPRESCDFGEFIYHKFDEVRTLGSEIHEMQLMKLQYEMLQLEFCISYEELEIMKWNHISPGACMPYVNEMLECLKRKGIRSGVISNIGWSGYALTERINRLLPENEFEFIIASSEYGIRKPDPMIFQLAMEKAGLKKEELWYCGNSIRADVNGAINAGIFPVFYEDLSMGNYWEKDNKGFQIEHEHLYVHNWREFIDVLEKL